MSTKMSLTGLLLVNLLASAALVRSTGAEEPGALHHGVPDVAKGLPESKPDSVPGSRPQDLAQGTITIEGKGLPPEVKEVIAAHVKRLLSEAIGQAVREGWKEVLQKLKLADEIETKLFSQEFELGGPDGEEEVWAISLIKPAEEVRKPELTVLNRDGKPLFRFTRAFAPVDSPIAIVNWTRVIDGRPVQSELLLVYEKDGKWKQHPASERTEHLDPGTAQEDEDKLWEAFRKSQQEPAESFEKAGFAAVSSRKLLGLTRKEVEAKLGKPSSADWFVHVTKPRFMGDRVRYTRDGPKADEYLSLGLFIKNGKVYACYFGVFDRVTGKTVEKYHQESVGKPIRLTIN
jgi:hypothetical protein